METQRLNPYLLPHKGLRNLLAKVSFLAGNLDYTSVHEIDQLKIFANELLEVVKTEMTEYGFSNLLNSLEKKDPLTV